jgi:hypothetical protein
MGNQGEIGFAGGICGVGSMKGLTVRFQIMSRMKKLNWILFAALLTVLPDAWVQRDLKPGSSPTTAPPRVSESHRFADARGATNEFRCRVDRRLSCFFARPPQSGQNQNQPP